jgi:beta-glucanase (GH16 family)
LAEVAVDGSGRHYGTVHWNNNGSDAYNCFIYDGVRGGVFHDYAVRWEPGRLTFFVDGAQKATTTSNVPRDYDAGGMNNVIGFLNNSGSSSVTVRDVDYSPL